METEKACGKGGQIVAEMKKNDRFTGRVESYTSQGQGVVRRDGRAVFVPGTLEGELCLIHVLKASRTAVYARAEEVTEPSPHRCAPACPFYSRCGGCAALHMDYEEELRFKRAKVDSALQRIGGLDLRTEGITGADSRWRYRNKAVYAVANGPEGAVTGFYHARSHQVVPVTDCLIQSEYSVRAAKALREWMDANGVRAWEDGAGDGPVRHLFARYAFGTDEGQVALVSAKPLPDALAEDFVRRVLAACPETRSAVLLVNREEGNTVLKGESRVLWGAGTIRDVLCGNSYELSPLSFYQVNREQAQRLYDCAMEFAGAGIDLALDLYCGAGTITLCLARRAKRVVGCEIVPSAVRDAQENARRNGVGNVRFYEGDAGSVAARLRSEGLHPQVIVVDPPRKGLSEETIEAAAGMEPERIVYVSCDPATLARDLKRFDELGYRAFRARAFDLFPGTSHVESVVLMSRA